MVQEALERIMPAVKQSQEPQPEGDSTLHAVPGIFESGRGEPMNGDDTYMPEYRGQATPCLVCGDPSVFRLARGRKSGKPFVMLVCGRDGRHFRGFINHQPYVREVLNLLEARNHDRVGDQP